MKKLAFSENAMFDGDGNLIHLLHYIDDMFGQDEVTSELYINFRKAQAFEG